MRNLKRVLSLALASIMLLGMMVVGASAADKTYADLTDSDKITNQEAVSVLVDIGIIEGKTDGSYDPAATVDRATMAKLITMMLMGNVDQSAFQGTVTDLKDIDSSWAEGYIKYCYANGIIEGDGKGNFFPTEPVTVVQAAKMLLVAIGYNAENRGYSNDANWSTNIMRDAQTTLFYGSTYTTTIRSLTKGLSVKATDSLTRDNAAQMIFNALFVQNYDPEYQYDGGVRYISKYTALPSLAATTYNGLNRNVGVLTAVNDDGYATVTGGDIVPTKKISGDVTLMGKAVAYYKDASGLVSSAVVEDKDNTAVTVPGDLVNNSAKSKDVTKWLTNNGLELSASNAYIVTNYVATNTRAITAADLAGIGNYAVAYVIDSNGDGVVDALVKTTKTVSEVTGAVKTKTDSDGKVTVSIPGVTAGYVSAVGYEDLSKGDLVMHITYAGTTYITECESVNGKITGYKGTSAIYIDGTSYTRSDGAYGGQTVTQMKDLDTSAKKDVTLFLDENGNALYAKLVDATSTYNVAVVLGYDTVGSSVEDSITATARLLFADGTVDVVNVSGGNGTSIAPGSTLTSSAQTAGTNYYLAAYTIDSDGNYELTKLTTSDVDFGGKDIKYTTITNASIAPGKAVFTDGFIGNSSTAFLVANYSSSNNKFSTAATTTGIANAPKYTGTADGVVITVDGTAALVFVTDGTLQDASATSNYIYIPSSVTPSYSSADKLYTYSKGYVNGEEQDIISKIALTTGAVMKVSLNDDDVVISETAHGGVAYKGVSFGNDVLTVDTATAPLIGKAYYTLADDAKVFEIDSDGKITEIAASGITADKTDGVIVLGASDMSSTMKAQYVYITKADSSATTATVSVNNNPVASANTADTAASCGTPTKNTTVTVSVTDVADGATVSVTLDREYSTSFVANATLSSDGAGAYTFTCSNPASGSVVDMVCVTVTAEDGTVATYYGSMTINA